MIAAATPFVEVAERARAFARSRCSIESLEHFAGHFQEHDRFDDNPSDLDLLEAIHIVQSCFGWTMSMATLFCEAVLVDFGDDLPEVVDRMILRGAIDGVLDGISSIQLSPC